MSDGGTRVVVVTTLLGLVVAVIALLYGEGLLTRPPSSSPSESPPLPIPSTTNWPTSPPIETSSPPTVTTTTTMPSDSTGSTVVPQYLHQMRAVDRGQYGNVLRAGPFSINGKPYPHSFSFYNRCNNADGGDIWTEYNLGRAYNQFTATVGFSDEDPVDATGTFTVLADGAKVASGSLKLGMSIPVSVNVAGVLRLRLIANDPRAAESCARKSHPTTTIWGDALVS